MRRFHTLSLLRLRSRHIRYITIAIIISRISQHQQQHFFPPVAGSASHTANSVPVAMYAVPSV